MRPIILLAAFCLVASCATPFVLMVNPKSGQSVECSASGFGIIPAVAATNRVNSCVEQYEGIGYLRADQLTKDQKAELNIQPPNKEHRLDVKPPEVIVAPGYTPQPQRSFNCTTLNTGGSLSTTNCY